jgi:hypothetical protein
MSTSRDSGSGLLGLWSVPRGRSTAFLRMMKERGDHLILHEPFGAVRTAQLRKSSMQIDGVTVTDDASLIGAMQRVGTRNRVFFKVTNLLLLDVAAIRDLFRSGTHTFLIREPKDVIASLYAMEKKRQRELQRDHFGFEQLNRIYDAVVEETGREPVVINSDDLMADPAGVIRGYCAAVGIPFIPEALSWQSGLIPEWTQQDEQVLHRIKDSQESTIRSTAFTDPGSQYSETTDNSPVLAEYLAYHEPFYQRLNERRLTAG